MCPIDVTKSGIDEAEGRDYGLKFHPIDLSRNADCIVRIDQDEFHCHLLVLQSYSTFFDERNYKEIDLTGVSYRNFSFIPLFPLGIADTCALPVSREQKDPTCVCLLVRKVRFKKLVVPLHLNR